MIWQKYLTFLLQVHLKKIIITNKKISAKQDAHRLQILNKIYRL